MLQKSTHRRSCGSCHVKEVQQAETPSSARGRKIHCEAGPARDGGMLSCNNDNAVGDNLSAMAVLLLLLVVVVQEYSTCVPQAFFDENNAKPLLEGLAQRDQPGTKTSLRRRSFQLDGGQEAPFCRWQL